MDSRPLLVSLQTAESVNPSKKRPKLRWPNSLKIESPGTTIFAF